MVKDYIKLTEGSLVKKGYEDKLANSVGIVFDCDGVLISAKDSYDIAIYLTIKRILKALTNIEIEFKDEIKHTVYGLRRTGAFNNDWNSVYSITIFLLLNLPNSYILKLTNLLKKHSRQRLPGLRLKYVENEINKENFDDWAKSMKVKVKEVVDLANHLGYKAVESSLIKNTNEVKREFITIFKEFLPYPSDVGEGIIETLFNGYFYSDLDSRVKGKGFDDEFKFRLIDNEKVLIREDVLKYLRNVFSKNVGIASGRSFFGSKYTLKHLINYFNKDAMAFLEDDIVNARSQKEKDMMAKPNPYSLLKAAKQFKKGFVIYVGDSVEDALMVRNANRKNESFLFAGIANSKLTEEKVEFFSSLNACLILKDVNEIKDALIKLRGKEE